MSAPPTKGMGQAIWSLRRRAAARFLCLSSTASDAFFLFFHEKEKKEWGAEVPRGPQAAKILWVTLLTEYIFLG